MPVSLYAFVPQLGCTVRFLSGPIYNVNSQNLRPMQTSAYKRRPNAFQVQTKCRHRDSPDAAATKQKPAKVAGGEASGTVGSASGAVPDDEIGIKVIPATTPRGLLNQARPVGLSTEEAA